MAKRSSGARTSKRARGGRTQSGRRWSREVTEHSDAMDLEGGIFKSKDPERIARSVKSSAEHSGRRKGTVRQSATSMLNFYENRAGKNLTASQRQVLERAKVHLRAMFEHAH